MMSIWKDDMQIWKQKLEAVVENRFQNCKLGNKKNAKIN